MCPLDERPSWIQRSRSGTSEKIVKMIALRRVLILSVLLIAGYAAILCLPSPFFSFAVSAHGVTLHSDQPLPDAATRTVLDQVHAKLEHSPLYSPGMQCDVFICNARWRERLFFNKDYGVGGVAPYPVTSNVFIREAAVGDNRLIGPHGNPVPGDRTLDYFVAHEITHQLTGRAMGPMAYFRLPQWVREGYADYVGKGSGYGFEAARQAFLAGAPEMDWHRSGLYSRFHLLVAFLLDRSGWTVDRLLRNPPEQSVVEAQLRGMNGG